ncbi:MAG TPA: UbiA family prenyltransferase [Longimicrobiales bacterium]|nr:UbiA family prenyltransferase [Longimicrobiales bacterium]
MKAPTVDRSDAAGTLARWGTLVRERFRPGPLLALAAALAASAQLVVAPRLDATGLIIGAVGVSALLGLLRLMDEVKDLDRDRIAHPERPLPRGVVRPDDARRAIHLGVGALLLGAGLLAALRAPVTGALYGVCVAYAALMYREFFLGRVLEARPFTYAATHQVIVLPMYAFATAAAAPADALDPAVLWFGLTGLGASFAFEVCRKLDPHAHPALGTYLSVHGPGRTFAAAAAAVALASFAAYRIGVHPWVWPAALLLLAVLAGVRARPERFARAEAAAGLFALVQVLAPTLARLWAIGLDSLGRIAA